MSVRGIVLRGIQEVDDFGWKYGVKDHDTEGIIDAGTPEAGNFVVLKTIEDGSRGVIVSHFMKRLEGMLVRYFVVRGA